MPAIISRWRPALTSAAFRWTMDRFNKVANQWPNQSADVFALGAHVTQPEEVAVVWPVTPARQ